MGSYKTEIDYATLKAICDELNKPKYIVYGSQHLSEDSLKVLEDQRCEYRYVAPQILGAPENTFYVLPSKILENYCYKEDYYE